MPGRLKQELFGAVARRDFDLHYQPKYRLDTGELQGVEALLRWRASSGAWIAPSAFIPVLEQTGLIDEVGEWIFQCAAADCEYWRRQGYGVPCMAINVSPIQLRRTEALASVLDLCSAWPAGATALEIELTESALMPNRTQVVDVLNRLAKRNVTISLDDFGSGHSSLSLLASLPVRHLKIDQDFTASLIESRRSAMVLDAIVKLARELDMETVAEGVETADQLRRVRALGCDVGQGFFFSRALDREALLQMLPVIAEEEAGLAFG